MFRKRFALAVALSLTSAAILPGSMLLATPAEAGPFKNAVQKVTGKIGGKLFGNLGAGVAAAAQQNQIREALKVLPTAAPKPNSTLGADLAAAFQVNQIKEALKVLPTGRN
jgi:hypothetical protein